MYVFDTTFISLNLYAFVDTSNILVCLSSTIWKLFNTHLLRDSERKMWLTLACLSLSQSLSPSLLPPPSSLSPCSYFTLTAQAGERPLECGSALGFCPQGSFFWPRLSVASSSALSHAFNSQWDSVECRPAIKWTCPVSELQVAVCVKTLGSWASKRNALQSLREINEIMAAPT